MSSCGHQCLREVVVGVGSVGVHHPFESFNLCTLYMHYLFIHDDDKCNKHSEIPDSLFSVLKLAIQLEILDIMPYPMAPGGRVIWKRRGGWSLDACQPCIPTTMTPCSGGLSLVNTALLLVPLGQRMGPSTGFPPGNHLMASSQSAFDDLCSLLPRKGVQTDKNPCFPYFVSFFNFFRSQLIDSRARPPRLHSLFSYLLAV